MFDALELAFNRSELQPQLQWVESKAKLIELTMLDR